MLLTNSVGGRWPGDKMNCLDADKLKATSRFRLATNRELSRAGLNSTPEQPDGV